jgi:hypothetical protein
MGDFAVCSFGRGVAFDFSAQIRCGEMCAESPADVRHPWQGQQTKIGRES